MTAINMARANYLPAFNRTADHAGLMLERGLKEWPAEPDEKGEAFAGLIKRICGITPSKLYLQAYKRWYKTILEMESAGAWFGKLEGRLLIGVGEPSPLEAAITLHHTYGMPYLPGSAIKGVLHHYAVDNNILLEDRELLFGRELSPNDLDEGGDAGYLIFHDAWWIPEGRATMQRPLHPEVITVHHRDYYSSRGEQPATDFDSPNPNPQIAVQGSFFFAMEGEKSLVGLALQLLEQTMSQAGAGAKTSAGYGYMKSHPHAIERWKKKSKEAIKQRRKKGLLIEDEVGKGDKKSPLDKEMEDIVLAHPERASHRVLIDALKKNDWTLNKQIEVATYIQAYMKRDDVGVWREKPARKNPAKRNYKDTQTFIKLKMSIEKLWRDCS